MEVREQVLEVSGERVLLIKGAVLEKALRQKCAVLKATKEAIVVGAEG